MSLDDDYGPCLPHDREASIYEKTIAPVSLSILNKETGAALLGYLDATVGRLSSTLHQTTPILWLIDQDGNARFALEEVIDKETRQLRFILPAVQKPGETDTKLGHPALVAPSETPSARIGGEITFSEGHWRLSNKSGRFGFRPHLEEKHLNNAARLFSEYGVNLKPFWM